jgi:alpha-1,6-mannosyltransferase
VRAILARDPIARRAAARARAEEFGWLASVTAFLTVHEALNTDSFRPLGQVQA